jgi:hypothetical protein
MRRTRVRVDEKIEGDRAFRSRNGYADLLDIFRQELIETGVRVQTETIVESITWSKGRAVVTARRGKESLRLVAKRVLITLPLGVLQVSGRDSGAVRFTPSLPAKKFDRPQDIANGESDSRDSSVSQPLLGHNMSG